MRGGGGEFVLFSFVCVVVRVGCSFDKWKEAGTEHYLQRIQGYHDWVCVTPSLQLQPLGYVIYASSPDLCDVHGIREISVATYPFPLAFSALQPGPIHNMVLAKSTPGLGLKLKRSTEN